MKNKLSINHHNSSNNQSFQFTIHYQHHQLHIIIARNIVFFFKTKSFRNRESESQPIHPIEIRINYASPFDISSRNSAVIATIYQKVNERNNRCRL